MKHAAQSWSYCSHHGSLFKHSAVCWNCWLSSCCSYRQWFSFASTCDECEPLRFNGDACFLYVLFSIPKMKATGVKIYSLSKCMQDRRQLKIIFTYCIFMTKCQKIVGGKNYSSVHKATSSSHCLFCLTNFVQNLNIFTLQSYQAGKATSSYM